MVTKFSIYRMTVSGWTEAFSLPLGKAPDEAIDQDTLNFD